MLPVKVNSLGRTRRTALVGAMCVGLAAGATVLTGCSEKDPDAGTNGLGKLSAAKIQSKATKAAAGASTVRLTGSVVTDGETFKLDMRLKDDGGSGKVTSKNETFSLLRVGEHLYLKADASFWSHQKGNEPTQADNAAGQKLDGMYVKVPQGDPSYKQLTTFTDKDLLLNGLLTLHGKVATGERGTMNGLRTITLSGDKGAGGTLEVALEGKPYPMLLERAGDAGSLELTDWNKSFDLREPGKDETVDYGQQLPTS